MHFKSVCLLAVCLVAVSDAATTMTIKLLDNPKDNCWKYCAKGADSLRITHARILQLSDVPGEEGKITGNIICDFGGKKNYQNRACNGQYNKTPTKRIALMLSVTADVKMMLSQVEYRYTESTMKLFEKNYLDVETLKDLEFLHDQHIQIKNINIKVDGVTYNVVSESCHAAGSYPGALIADHGLFVVVFERDLSNFQWQRMYFDPSGLGERILTTP